MTTPNKWVIVKITREGKDTIHKVFGSWSGGYLDGDSWRLNSGINKIEHHEDHYIFQGYSGSTYKCAKTRYGIAGASNWGVLDNLCERMNGVDGVFSSVLKEKEMLQWVEAH